MRSSALVPRALLIALVTVVVLAAGWVVDEIYLDLGDQFSGSSVAAVHGERLLVGAIYDAGILDCRMR